MNNEKKLGVDIHENRINHINNSRSMTKGSENLMDRDNIMNRIVKILFKFKVFCISVLQYLFLRVAKHISSLSKDSIIRISMDDINGDGFIMSGMS